MARRMCMCERCVQERRDNTIDPARRDQEQQLQRFAIYFALFIFIVVWKALRKIIINASKDKNQPPRRVNLSI
jgi:hypothetical protein